MNPTGTDPPQERFRLHFLVYAPRSGSTLFAKTLADTYPGTMILPEFRTAEYLLARSERRVRRLSSRSLRRVFLADRQLLTNLGISSDEAAALAREHAGEGTLDILSALIVRYADGAAPAKDVVLKLGGGAEFLPRLREVSPDGTVVHVFRDGRAAVSSLLRTPRAYFRNETMGRDDVAHCCGIWLRHQQTVRRGGSEGYRVISLRFETFVEDPEGHCHDTGLAMRLEDTCARPVRSFRVSEAEAGLHPLVHETASSVRSSAWREEMHRRDQVFADWRMRDELARLGYDDRVLPPPEPRELLRCIATAYAQHARSLGRYALRRTVAYARHPGAVVEHLNARTARYFSRRRQPT